MKGEEKKLDFREREIVLRANFAELDDDQCIPVPVRFLMQGPRHPRAGEWVYLLDSRGCGCLGRVESIEGWMARVKPDWGSWTGDESHPVPGESWPAASIHPLQPRAGGSSAPAPGPSS